MIAPFIARTLCATAIAVLAFAQDASNDARAQQQPTAAAVALAREVVEIKGAITMFDPVFIGVIEHNKGLLLQANPTASRDLEDVANRLRVELAPRRNEIHTEIARGYASQFTEAELKEIVAFYKTPIGKKLITAEAAGADEATKRVDAWASKFADEVAARFRADLKKKGINLL
jgi:hypothetical protein